MSQHVLPPGLHFPKGCALLSSSLPLPGPPCGGTDFPYPLSTFSATTRLASPLALWTFPSSSVASPHSPGLCPRRATRIDLEFPLARHHSIHHSSSQGAYQVQALWVGGRASRESLTPPERCLLEKGDTCLGHYLTRCPHLPHLSLLCWDGQSWAPNRKDERTMSEDCLSWPLSGSKHRATG